MDRISQLKDEKHKLTSQFYENGKLYPALEGNKLICGNYTAITNALLKMLDIHTEYLVSDCYA